MATKSKNKRGTLAVWMLACCLTAVSLLSASDIIARMAFLDSRYYFQSAAFYSQLELNFNLVQYMKIDNRDFEKLSDDAKIGKERMAGWQQEYRALSSAETLLRLDERKMEYLAYKNQEYNDVARSLQQHNRYFSYYIQDRTNNIIYSNIGLNSPASETLNQEALYTVHLPQINLDSPFLRTMNSYFLQHDLDGMLIVPKTYSGYSQIHADYEYYLSIRERVLKEIAVGAAAAVLAAGLIVSLLRSRSWDHAYIGRAMTAIKLVPIDLRYVIAIIVAVYAAEAVGGATVFRLPLLSKQLLTGVWFMGLLALLALILLDIRSLYRDPSLLKVEWQRSCVRRLQDRLGRTFTNSRITVKIALLTLLTMLFGFFALLGIFALSSSNAQGQLLISCLYMALYAALVAPYAVRRLDMLNRLLEGVQQIAGGDLNTPLPESGDGYLSQLARHMNNMKLGYKRSLEEQMRSERLKSELITNVSHDLKTPLTSILNYVDLLKNKEATAEEAAAYIEILDRKSQRLKVLIDDLFEASKMASGSVELHREAVNVASLLEQALAEFDDRLANQSLTVRTDIPGKKIMAELDGKKTWRVFENLIGNAVKYALPQSRIYISLTEGEREVALTIKNVSAFEIDYDVTELFERFKRGDSSRHTEGSGLGLAIAKSIVDLQGGQLRIEIDGDYFKVTVALPKAAAA